MQDAYIASAIWSSTDDDGEPLDNDYSADDLDDETLAEMEADVKKFFDDNDDLIFRAWEEDDASEGDIGHNFWLTRNGHGAGFWDGDFPVTGDDLTIESKKFGETSLYIGDDDKIYSFSG